MGRVIYHRMGDKLFADGKMPSRAIIWDQIQLAQLSTIVYAMLPVLGEFFIEEGYTRYSAGMMQLLTLRAVRPCYGRVVVNGARQKL